MESNRLEMLKQIADALAAQFGPNCEVVIRPPSSLATAATCFYTETPFSFTNSICIRQFSS